MAQGGGQVVFNAALFMPQEVEEFRQVSQGYQQLLQLYQVQRGFTQSQQEMYNYCTSRMEHYRYEQVQRQAQLQMQALHRYT